MLSQQCKVTHSLPTLKVCILRSLPPSSLSQAFRYGIFGPEVQMEGLTWSPAGGAVWENYGTFKRWSLAGGSTSLVGGFEESVPWLTSCLLTASEQQMLCA